MRKKVSPLEKEWTGIENQELQYLNKRMDKKNSKLNQLLEKKVPENLQNTLDVAFSKAFSLIFEKGVGIIEKTYNKDELEKTYKINEYTAQVRDNKKSLKAFSKKASGSANLNFLISGVSGIGLGVLGIGIPDIVLFTGLMLKSIYEIALNYGFDYEHIDEKKFILLLIQGAVSYGDELQDINEELNGFMENGIYSKEYLFKEKDVDGDRFEEEDFQERSEDDILNELIDKTAGCLSKELLYMKFLQGIPVVGAVGGAYDAIYMKKVVEYAKMKYHRRFLMKRIKEKNTF